MTTDKRYQKSGWKQWRADEAREALRAWQASGLSMGAFARQEGMSAQRLSWWRKRLGDWATSNGGVSELRLVPVVTSVSAEVVSQTRAIAVMRLPGAVVVEFDAGQVSARWVAEVSQEVSRAG